MSEGLAKVQRSIDLCAPCVRCYGCFMGFGRALQSGACCAVLHCACCCTTMCLVGGFGVWAMVAFGNAARNPPVLHLALPVLAYTDFKTSVQLEVNASLGVHNKLGWPFIATVERVHLDVYSLDIQQRSTKEIKIGSAKMEPTLPEIIKIPIHGNGNFTFRTDSKVASIDDADMSALKARIARDCHSGAKVTKLKVTVNPRFDMRFGIRKGQEDELSEDFIFDVWCQDSPVDAARMEPAAEQGTPAPAASTAAQLEGAPDADAPSAAALRSDAPVLV